MNINLHLPFAKIYKLVLLFVFISLFSNAQIVTNNAFLKGNFVELGMCNGAVFGSTLNAPVGYHPRPETGVLAGRLGFVVDQQKNGWATGAPNYCGDYFLPGSPEEGWGIEIGGPTTAAPPMGSQYGNANNCGSFYSAGSIPGTFSNYVSNIDTTRVDWIGNIAGLQIKQRTIIPQNATYFVAEITITNTSATTKTNVFYLRSLDPDNDQTLAGGSFTTSNCIVSQPSGSSCDALVTAAGTIYPTCFLGLAARDQRARVTRGGFSNYHPSDVWYGTSTISGEGTAYGTVGCNTFDEGISLAFKLGDIKPGQSVTFAFAYVLNSSDVSAALAAVGSPSIPYSNGTDVSVSTSAGATSVCAPGSSVTLELFDATGFTWNWSPSTALNTTTGTTVIASPTATTTYTAVGTSLCSTITRTFYVNITSPTDLSATVTNTSCGLSTGAINVTGVSGGLTPFSYSFNGSSFSTSTSATGLTSGVYTITVKDKVGCTYSESVTIANSNAPTVANAGADQTICGTTASLSANTAVVGTGTWSVVSGTATITSPTSSTSTITGLSVGNVVMRWTISNSTCTPTTDVVTITTKAAPNVADAGTNQVICGTSTTLAGNTAVIGTGTWSVASGTATITNPISPTSTITGLALGTVVMRWSITNAPCTASTDLVTITIASSTTASAGPDQNICGTSATLAGNIPPFGTGTWTIVSGTGTITSVNNPISTVTSITSGTNIVLRWTVANPPCTSASDDVTIRSIATPTASNAGPDQILCGTSATLAGNTAVIGTGTWSVVSGTASITNPTSPTSTITGLSVGNVVMRWSITNAPCTASTDVVTITITGTSIANAGTDQTVCGTSTTLAANTPGAGTGTWSVISGTALVSNVNSPISTVTGLTQGSTSILRWSVSNPPCIDASDDVTIKSVASPTIADAGSNFTICGTTATMAGNTPTVGTGTWTRISGTGTITGVNNPLATITGITGASSVFRWTISNPPCATSFDNITITRTAPTTSNAGVDQNVCNTSTTLAGNAPTIGTGTWTIVSGSGTITNSALRNTTVTALTPGTYTVFRWTIDNPPCTPSTDDVTIRSAQTPTISDAGADISICGTTATMAGNTPTVGTGTWTRISGTGTITGINNPAATITGITSNSVFRWTIANAPCTASFDNITITRTAPTTSNSGANQNICGTSTTLAGNTPTVGTGTWSVVSGSATFANSNSPTSVVTGLTAGTNNILRWTIDNPPCTSSASDVTIVATNQPTISNAGSDIDICGTIATLAGNTPTVGTGTWTRISGTGTITGINNPLSTVTGITSNSVFRWTIANAPCTASTDDVSVRVITPSVSNAGTNQNICGTSTTLAGNIPTIGTGTWSVVNGTATFANANSAVSTVAGLTAGTNNILRWTITNSPCVASVSDVTIVSTNPPTVADAGSNQIICISSTTLSGNTPTIGTGSWSIVSGTATITNSALANTTITGINSGTSVVLRWSIANAPCTTSTDDVIVSRLNNPTTANAGADKNICTSSTAMAANSPTVGTGIWSIVSGIATVANINSPTTNVTGMTQGSSVVLRWSIANAPCVSSTDDVTINYLNSPTVSNAGPDQTICAATTLLAANTPTVGTGSWSIVSGSAGIVNSALPNTTLIGIVVGSPVVLRWSISNGVCAPSTDDVTITRLAPPTFAAAGTDKFICTSSTTMSANTPFVGTGTWSVITGTATITNANSPTSTITGLTQGTSVTLRWTISNNPCNPSFDDVVINYLNNPTTANAGPDQTICAASTSLAANPPTIGLGFWTVVSGAATFTNPNLPNTLVNGIASGATVVLRWNISNAPCLVSTDDVTIKRIVNPTIANAGTDQNICGTSTTINANVPVIGTGSWSVVSGTATLTNPNNVNTSVTALGVGAVTLRWTIQNAPCVSSTDDVVINVFGSPTTSNAGTNQTICSSTTTMAANTPLVGIGNWSVITGTATFANSNSPTSGVTGLTAGTNNILRWTIFSPGCSTSSSDVTIRVDAVPTTADAGINQTVCGTTSTLSANVPSIGTGTWSVVSGTATFSNANLATASVSGLAAGANVLRWTINNGVCASSQDEVTIQVDLIPDVANAGLDQNICADTTFLAANTPLVGVGLWTLVSGSGIIVDVNNATTQIRNLPIGTTELHWSITNGVCPVTTDVVILSRDSIPTVANAGADQYLCGSAVNLAANAPTIGTGVWSIVSGTATIANATNPLTAVTDLAVGNNVLRWTISNGVCAPSIDEVSITVFPTMETTITSVNSPSPCGTATGSALAVVTGGSGRFSYSWNSIPVQTNASLLAVTGGNYLVTVTDSLSACTSSATVNIIDVGAPLVSLSDSDADNTICSRTPITFNASGADTYQFVIDGINVGTASATASITTDTLTVNHSVWVIGTSTANACSSSSLITTISVILSGTPDIQITVSPSASVCPGTVLTFTSNVLFEGTAPTYLWKRNGTSVGVSPNYITTLNDGDEIKAILTSNYVCITGNAVDTSNAITIDIIGGSMIVAPSIITSPTCGNADGEIAVAVTGGTLSYTYAWNTLPIQTNSNASGLLAGTYMVTVTDGLGCMNDASIVLNNIGAPAISLLSNDADNTICNGSPVVFTASGATTFEFYINGISQGVATTLTTLGPITTLANSDVIHVQGNDGVCIGSSNAITFTVSTGAPIDVFIEAVPSATICAGTPVSFTSVVTNGGATPNYKWQVNNVDAGFGTGFGSLNSGDQIRLIVSDPTGCASPLSDTSNVVTMTINPNKSASVSITPTSTVGVCQGTNISFLSTAVNEGTNPIYAWYVNSELLGSGVAFQSNTLENGDTVKVILTSSELCLASNNVTSNLVSIDILTIPSPSVSLSKESQLCAGDTVTLSAYEGGAYLWSTGETTRNIIVNKSGTYSYEFTDAAGCKAKSTSASITVADSLKITLTSPTFEGGYNVSKYQTLDGSIDATVTGGFIPYAYYWSNEQNTEDVNNLSAGNYQLVIIDNVRCSDTAYINLTTPPPLQLPRVFTPNGDGVNDFFVIKGVEVFPNTEVAIYNRWGNVIFESKDYKNEWQGQSRSGDAPDGTYFVVMTAKNIDGSLIVLDGYIELKRHNK